MVQIFRGIHVGYTDAGIPIIAELPSDSCVGDWGDFIGADHIGYNADGIPILASALRCCDVVDTCPKVEETCLDGGIARKLGGHSKNNLNCRSAEGNNIILNYCQPCCLPDSAVSDSTAGDVAWTDPNNVALSDNTYATCTLSASQTTEYLIVYSPCCRIESAPIKIEVQIEAKASDTLVADYEVKLVKAGTIVGNNKAAGTDIPTTDTTRSYLYTQAQWGVTLTAEDVMDPLFGVAIRYINNSGGSRTISPDHVTICLHLCGEPEEPPTGCTPCEEWPLLLPRTGIDTGVVQRRWQGSLSLRGGTLNFELCCFLNPGLAFRLIWRGCDSGCMEVFPQCTDPIYIHFDQFTVPNCCSCLDTEDQGTIEFYVVGNCYPVINAEHVGYTDGGTPIVARERVCDWDLIEGPTCYPSCELEMTITDIVGTGTETDCSCFEGVWSFPATGYGGWSNINVGTCPTPAVITMTCEVLVDGDSRPTGFVRLSISVTCGATNTGSDYGDIWWEDLEELDVTFDVYLTDPTAGDCTGNCDYIWIDMLGQWQTNGDNCTGTNCDACPMTPDDNSPGGFDGDTRSQPCTGATAAACCLGWIEIRVRRPT